MSKENRQFGREGGEIIKDANTHADKNFYAISFYEDTIISAITITDAAGTAFVGSLAGETLPAGYVLYGKITSIKLTSGACIGYNDDEE